MIEEVLLSILRPFLDLLDAKLIEIEQYEIDGKKPNFAEKHDQSIGSSTKAYCAYIHVNPGCTVCIGKRNESCVV